MKSFSAFAACATIVTLLASPAWAGPEIALMTTQGARSAFVHTDENGDFSFANITWGMYIVQVNAGGVDIGNGMKIGGRNVPLQCGREVCRSKLIELRGAVAGHVNGDFDD